ncbi:MAG: alpha-amylase family glycosyl hydrolase [Rikenellaceae bacterium]
MRKLSINILCAFAWAALLVAPACSPPSDSTTQEKIIIYQIFTRLFGSDNLNVIPDGPLSVNGVGKFEDFTPVALDSIRAMGITHIWYTGVIEHATIYSVDNYGGLQMNHPGVIKGKAGSPYAIKDYYDVNAYLSTSVERRIEEFEELVARTHEAEMKVIIDFVPNHVARGYHSDMAPEAVEDLGANDDVEVAFSPNNNFYYIPGETLTPQFSTADDCEPYVEYPAKVTGNDVFSASPNHNDWYETVKLNYGIDYLDSRKSYFDPIPDTWLKMRDILIYWAAKGVDGFRCDMAEMTPCEFWGWAIDSVKEIFPDVIFIAEIYNPEAYATYINDGGFDYLYDKVGLYDTLKGVVQGRVPSSAITQSRAAIAPVQQHMLNFLENHDEQRIAWHEFAGSAKAGIPMMLVSTLSDNIPMMIYFGQELGEESAEATGYSAADGRTTIFDFWTMPLYQTWRNGGKFDGKQLDEQTKTLRRQYIDLLQLAQHPLFIDGRFVDLTEYNSKSSSRVYAFARRLDRDAAIVVSNLSSESVITTYSLPSELSAMKMSKILFNSEDLPKESPKLSETGDLLLTLSPHQALVIELKL